MMDKNELVYIVTSETVDMGGGGYIRLGSVLSGPMRREIAEAVLPVYRKVWGRGLFGKRCEVWDIADVEKHVRGRMNVRGQFNMREENE